jgi:hypothetical protein
MNMLRTSAPDGLHVITGGADGTDKFAEKWCKISATLQWPNNLTYETVKADWERHGRAAGPIRNDQMLKLLLSIEDEYRVGAFIDKPLPESKGTNIMVSIALKAGVEVDVIHAYH